MAAKKKSNGWLVVYSWDDGSHSVWNDDQYTSEEDALEGARECLNENNEDAQEVFIVVKTHKVSRDYKVEKL
ncbi:MAG TPA: hypothetical protein VIY48_18580 [Candidatus Paceibacterota bacterium]